MKDLGSGVQVSSVVAETKAPWLAADTRYNYLVKYIPLWKDHIKYRLYFVTGLIVGVWSLFNFPLLALPAFFASTYYYQQFKLLDGRMFKSQRTIIWGH